MENVKFVFKVSRTQQYPHFDYNKNLKKKNLMKKFVELL